MSACFRHLCTSVAARSPNKVEEITGVSAKDIFRAAEMFGPEQRISHAPAWSGVGQHTNATRKYRQGNSDTLCANRNRLIERGKLEIYDPPDQQGGRLLRFDSPAAARKDAWIG